MDRLSERSHVLEFVVGSDVHDSGTQLRICGLARHAKDVRRAISVSFHFILFLSHILTIASCSTIIRDIKLVKLKAVNVHQ